MKILLVKPSSKFKTIVPRPPLGLAYIAAYIEEKSKHETKIIDMYTHDMSQDSLLSEIQRFLPELIGFSAMTPWINIVGALAKSIKETFGQEICLAVGGPHPSTIPIQTLEENPHLDIAVSGEGEETMLELSNVIDNGEDISSVNGIAYRNQGAVNLNPPRSLIKNIDDIPYPAWNKLDMSAYLSFDYLFNKKAFPIITSRGCTGQCTFCDAHGVWTKRVRLRSAENIVNEMLTLKIYGVNHISFWDDNFLMSAQRIERICKILESNNPKMTWECLGRVDRVNKGLLGQMKKAGCTYVAYGIESGSQEILDYVKKNITLKQIRAAVKATKEAGLRAGGFFMVGFPTETEEQVKKTVEFVKELNLDWASGLSMLVPYPGTEIYKQMKAEGLILREEWDDYYTSESNIKTRHIDSIRLLELKTKYDKEIASYMYKKELLHHLKNLDKTALRFIKNPPSFIKAASRLITEYAKVRQEVRP